MAKNQGSNPRNRAAVYIDGFNLYHPVHEMAEPHLKWCNLWALSELICKPQKFVLQKVVFCTAVPQFDHGKRDRHNTFNAAQAAYGVTILKGHHVFDETAQKYNEKQSDINVALALILDAVDNLYDAAFLISADSDQAATARVFSERFPDKKLIGVAPPNKQVPQKAVQYFSSHFALKKEQIENTIMPSMVQGASGFIRRPAEYAPPDGWLPPHQWRKK